MRVLVRDLIAGEAYAIQFRARTATQESEWSQVLRLSTSLDVLAPAAVTGLNAFVSGTSFVVTWNGVTTNTNGTALKDFRDYEVQIIAGSEDETYYVTQPRFDFPIEVNEGAFGDPKPSLTFKVRARDVNYNSVPTPAQVSVTNPAPNAPGAFVAQPGVNNINFTWGGVVDKDLKFYRIYKGATAQTANTKIYEGLSTNFTYSSTNFSSNEFFRVAAVDVFGQETFSANTLNAAPLSFDSSDATPPAAVTFPNDWFTSETDLSTPTVIRANVTLKWNPNAESDLGAYVIRWKRVVDSAWSQMSINGTATTDPATTAKINGLQHNTAYNFEVAARDKSGNVGPFSTPGAAGTTTTDNTGPATPATPTVTASLGQLIVNWTGKTSTSANMPSDFSHVEVHVSKSSGFTPVDGTLKTRIYTANKPQQVSVSGLDYGDLYYVRLVAFDYAGNSSGPSAQASGIPTRVTGNDIQDGQITTSKIADYAITAAKADFTARDIGGGTTFWRASFPSAAESNEGDTLFRTDQGNKLYYYVNGEWASAQDAAIANAVDVATGAQSTAAAAQTAANGKNKITYSTQIPSNGGNPGTAAGDMWFRRDALGTIIGMYEWSGSAWNSRTIENQIIANLDAGKITAGTISSDRIGANSITTKHLAVGNFDNLANNPGFEDSATSIEPHAATQPGASISTTARSGIRSAVVPFPATPNDVFYINGQLGSRDKHIKVAVGESYYVEAWVRSNSGTQVPVRAGFKIRDTAGGLLASTTGALVTPTGTWQKVSAVITVNDSTASYLVPYLTSTTSTAGGTFLLDDILVRRRLEGNLIVDGAITTDKIDANAVTASKVAAGAITAREIAAGSIDADRLKVGGGQNLVVDPAFENSDLRTIRYDNQSGTKYWAFQNTPASAYQGAGYYIYKSAESAAASLAFNYAKNPSFENGLRNWSQETDLLDSQITKLDSEYLGTRSNLAFNGTFDQDVDGWNLVTWDYGKARFEDAPTPSTFRLMMSPDESLNTFLVNVGETIFVQATITANASNSAAVEIAAGPVWKAANGTVVEGWPWTLKTLGKVEPGQTRTLETSYVVPAGVSQGSLSFHGAGDFVPGAVIWFDGVKVDRMVAGAGTASSRALTMAGQFASAGQAMTVYTDIPVSAGKTYTISAHRRHVSGDPGGYRINIGGEYLLADRTPVDSTRTNWCNNPSGEVAPSFNVASGTTGANAQQDTAGWNGDYSTRLTAETAGTKQFVSRVEDGYIPVGAGLQYTVSAYFRKIAGTARDVRVGLQYYNNSNAVVATSFSNAMTTTTSFARISATQTAPATATKALVIFEVAGAAVNDYVQVDGILVERSSTLGSYFDGAFPNRWNGTPHASSSTTRTVTQGQWTAISESWTRVDKPIAAAPANAAWLRVYLSMSSLVAGNFASQWDMVQIEDGLAVKPYFDGSTTNGAWSGAEHDSNSVLKSGVTDRALFLSTRPRTTLDDLNFIATTPGTEYYFGVMAMTDSLIDNGVLCLGYTWRKKDGTTGTELGVAWKQPSAPNTWERIEGKFKLPDTVVAIGPFVSVLNNRTGLWRVQHPDVRPVVPGVLIQDGAITAGSAIIANAAIDDAKIGNVSAGKITTGELAAGQRIIAGPEQSDHSELTYEGFRAYSGAGGQGLIPVITLGSGKNDYLSIIDASGRNVATIDQNGRAVFEGLNLNEWPKVQGVSIRGIVDPLPKGIIAYAQQGSYNNSNWVGEYGIIDVAFDTEDGRAYEVQTFGYSAFTSQQSLVIMRYRDGGSSQPNISSPLTYSHYVDFARGGAFQNLDNSFVQYWNAGPHRLLTTLTTGTGTMTLQGSPAIIIKDIGAAVPTTGSVNNGGGSAVVHSAQTYYNALPCQWSATYNGSGNLVQDGEMRQGYTGSHGDMKSLLRFPALSGLSPTATIHAVTVRVYANHWYNNAGGTAVIGASNADGRPAGGVGVSPQFHISGWPKPGWVDIPIPSSWYSNIRSGVIKGLSIGPGPNRSNEYYGRFDGVGNAHPPVFFIRYTQ